MADHDLLFAALTKPTSIHRIKIDGLFGYLSYTIPEEHSAGADFSRLIILYGDNGSGKTTILRLLFSLLSPYRQRGEKSYVARTPFKRFEISFDNGTIVTADKANQLTGSYSVSIRYPFTDESERTYHLMADTDNSIPEQKDLSELIQALGRLSISLYFLPDDRRVRSTFAAERVSDEEGHAARVQTLFLRGQRIWSTIGTTDELQHLDIAPVLADISTWFRRRAFQGSNAGEENATSIYLRVVNQIAALEGSSPAAGANYESTLVSRLNALAKQMDSFTRFGLIPPFPADRFLTVFVDAGSAAKRTIATVLEPYVDGIEARLKALEEVRDLLATYVETTNSFLTAKSLEFTLQGGAVIHGYQGSPLDPNLLSSGEKQLMLLLSNTILAREAASIFLIDEPELSLNVKWQRRLVEALLHCSRGSNIQYLLASHSLELITLHKAHAVRLISLGESSRYG